ncbi:hypothetical protein, partial [Intestinimonas sp.]|uniref:hypothetical protein n=1 Tax=Intestinimonas sp. TaxID=1965293 RepID=UPI003AB62A22
GKNLKRPMTEYVRNASDDGAVKAEIIALEKQALERWNDGRAFKTGSLRLETARQPRRRVRGLACPGF